MPGSLELFADQLYAPAATEFGKILVDQFYSLCEKLIRHVVNIYGIKSIIYVTVRLTESSMYVFKLCNDSETEIYVDV